MRQHQRLEQIEQALVTQAEDSNSAMHRELLKLASDAELDELERLIDAGDEESAKAIMGKLVERWEVSKSSPETTP